MSSTLGCLTGRLIHYGSFSGSIQLLCIPLRTLERFWFPETSPYEKKLYGTYMSKLYVKYRGHIIVKYMSHICILNVNEVEDI